MQRIAAGYLIADRARLPETVNTSSPVPLIPFSYPPCTGCTLGLDLSWNKHDVPSFLFLPTGDAGQLAIRDLRISILTFRHPTDTEPYGVLFCPFQMNMTLQLAGIRLTPFHSPDGDDSIPFTLSANLTVIQQPTFSVPNQAWQGNLSIIEDTFQVAISQLQTQLQTGIPLPSEHFPGLHLGTSVQVSITNQSLFAGLNVET